MEEMSSLEAQCRQLCLFEKEQDMFLVGDEFIEVDLLREKLRVGLGVKNFSSHLILFFL